MAIADLKLGPIPDAAQQDIDEVQEHYGFVPNIAAMMANAPAVIAGYRRFAGAFDETSLSPVERHVVLLAASVANECEYCVAAHSAAAVMSDSAGDIVDAIRHDQAIEDERLEALRALTAELVTERGWPSEATIQRFFDAGFQAPQVLEVVMGVALKTLTNYTNHIAATPLDNQFASFEWSASPQRTRG